MTPLHDERGRRIGAFQKRGRKLEVFVDIDGRLSYACKVRDRGEAAAYMRRFAAFLSSGKGSGGARG